jgi:putative ABC transport system substrate-binding protein
MLPRSPWLAPEMQHDQLIRREFITLIGGAAAAWPLSTQAQQPLRKIGFLSMFDENNPNIRSQVAEMFQGLSRLGWEVGRNLQLVQHWTAGDIDQARVVAKELVASQPDVISRPSSHNNERDDHG